MKQNSLLFVFTMVAVIVPWAVCEASEKGENRALEKNVYSLPVLNYDTEFYRNITDGDLKTFGDCKTWTRYACLVIDLEEPNNIDEVRVHCSNVRNLSGIWFNLKPHIAVYTGVTLNSLQFLREINPAQNYEDVNPDKRKQSYISFSDLDTYGRYVVLYFFKGWGLKLYEIEALKHDKTHRAFVPPISTISLKELWLKHASVSGWIKMSTEEITPHVKWSNPAVAGPLRALFFIGKGQFRAIAELNQRMELDWDWVPIIRTATVDRPEVSPMTVIEEKEALEKLSTDLDVIVLAASIKWADLPESVRSAILKKVEEGAGLICVDPIGKYLLPEIQKIFSNLKSSGEDIEKIKEKYALDVVRYMVPLRDDILSLGNYGSGKVALLKYDNFLKKERWNFSGSGLFPEFYPYKILPSPTENFYAFLIELMYRVSNRKSSIRISETSAIGENIRIVLNSEAVPAESSCGLSLHFEIRDKNYDPYAGKSLHLGAGKPVWLGLKQNEKSSSVSLPLKKISPVLRKGRNYINLWIRDVHGSVHDFAIVSVDVSVPGIKSINLKPEGYARGIGDFDVVLDSSDAGDFIEAEVTDAYSRLIWKNEVQVGEKDRVKFTMNLSDAMSPAANLKVSLEKDDRTIDMVRIVVPCGVDDSDDPLENYTFDVWGEAPWRLSYPWGQYALRKQRQAR